MGLDQWAKAHKPDNDDDAYELAYWRKHPNLEGWMANLWHSREDCPGGEFNCQRLYLSEEDLDELENAVLHAGEACLPETSGFFFGEPADDYYKATDLEFIASARDALAAGYKVYYTSWW